MAFRIRDLQAIHNNPQNKSVSKQQYSIPRASRFQRCHTVLSDKYYDLPTTNECKAAAFPLDKRRDIFVPRDRSPSPAHYSICEATI